MSQKDFHPMFSTSTATLHDAIEKHAHFKNLVEEAEERQAKAVERITLAKKEADEAEDRVQKQKVALISAVGTSSEEKTLSALQDARVECQRAKDLHEALASAYGQGPNLLREKKQIEQYFNRAKAAAVGEELNKLAEGTLEVLLRAYGCYEGSYDWPQFLEYVFPQQESRLRGRLGFEVLQGYGLQ